MANRDTRVKVLTLTRDAGSGVGGVEVLVYEIARRLDPERFESFICVTREPPEHRRELAAREMGQLAAEGVKVLELNRRAITDLLPYRKLYAVLRHERIDVIHAHMPRASTPGVLFGRLAGVPVIIAHEHGSVLTEGKLVRRTLERRIVGPGSDLVLAVSEYDRRNIIERSGIPPERVRVFRHGILEPQSSGHDLRPVLAPDRVPLIGAVGRLAPVKGFDDLIDAVAILAAERQVRCVIAGDGPEEGRLRSRIAELGLDHAVMLLGFRADIPDVLRALDVAVLSSHSEGSPLAIMEFMVAGVPIVATDAGGIPELVTDGEHGLLVPPRDPPALAAAIARVLDDPALDARLGAAARERGLREFGIEGTVTRLEQLYLELLAGKRPA